MENARIHDCFAKTHLLHFITIKPDNNKYGVNDIKFQSLLNYYKSKCVRYWMREVVSPKGFRHIHGLVQYPLNGYDMRKARQLSKAIQKYINRNIGFHTNIMLDSDGDIARVIAYIKNQEHNILLREAYSSSVLLIEPN